jgi:DNA-binding transcriptional ArsR family regulator
MDSVLEALANEGRRRVVRELRRNPGQKHGELLGPLGVASSNKGQLTKLLGPLEDAGIVRRTDKRYYVIESEAMGRLLSAAADVDAAARRILAQRAQTAVEDAERLAEELRAESGGETDSQ